MGFPVQEHPEFQGFDVAHADPLAPTEAIVSGTAAVLARRYAGALYALADERKDVDSVAADMRILKTLERESSEFSVLAHNPRLPRAALVKAVRQVAAAAKFSFLTSNFLGLLAQGRRLSLLPAICEQFLAELASRRGEFTAEVRTARPLSHTQEEQLATSLRTLAGGRVHLSVKEDKSLLGGIVVRMGSRLIDTSVRGKLERLSRVLKSQSMNLQKGAA
jgi:F-type H+-transporting ATPase subunit delta